MEELERDWSVLAVCSDDSSIWERFAKCCLVGEINNEEDVGDVVVFCSELDDEYCLCEDVPEIAESHETALLEWNVKCGGGSL